MPQGCGEEMAMSEGIKVGQRLYRADLRDEVEVLEATVVEVRGPDMRLARDSGRELWAPMHGPDAPWRGTRRAALERLRDESRRHVERCEESLESARHEMMLVEAALSAEVDDA
jgi:hypothetical protein